MSVTFLSGEPIVSDDENVVSFVWQLDFSKGLSLQHVLKLFSSLDSPDFDIDFVIRPVRPRAFTEWPLSIRVI